MSKSNENFEIGNTGVKLGDEIKYSANETKIGTWMNGKPLYRKCIEFGPLPNNTTKQIAHGITNAYIRHVYGIAYSTATTPNETVLPLPYAGYGAQNTSSISLDCVAGRIRIYAGSDRSYLSGLAIIEYTKTTD